MIFPDDDSEAVMQLVAFDPDLAKHVLAGLVD
jgi:hypothetical protein